jgi:diapolycopene oxygenase
MKSCYDVVIIGAGFAGLAAAIEVAYAGRSVAVFDARERVGGKAARVRAGVFVFDPGPSIMIMPWVYQELFSRTRANFDDYVTLDPVDPIFRLRTQDGVWMDIPSGRDAFLEAVTKHAPTELAGFQRLLAFGDRVERAVKQTFLSKEYNSALDFLDFKLTSFFQPVLLQPYKKLIDSWFSDPIIRAWAYSFPTYTGQTYDEIAPGALLIPYYMITQGVWYPRNGIASLPEALAKRGRELGAEIFLDTAVSSMCSNPDQSIHWKISLNQISSKDRIDTRNVDLQPTISTASVIAAVDPGVIARLVVSPVEVRVPYSTASFSYVSVQLGLNRRIVECSHHTTIFPSQSDEYYNALYRAKVLSKNPVLYIHTPSITHRMAAPAGGESLFVVVPVHSQAEPWQQRPAVLRKQLTLWILCELRQAGIVIRATDIEVIRVQTPGYFEEQDGNWHGSLFGAGKDGRVWWLLPPGGTAVARDMGLSRLVFAGGAVQPGAGMPMTTLSGVIAARRVISQLDQDTLPKIARVLTQFSRSQVLISLFLSAGLITFWIGSPLESATGVLLAVFFAALSIWLRTRWRLFAGIALTTLAIEALGVTTGVPFGEYEYGSSVLMGSLWHVPLFIPFAWYVLLVSVRQFSTRWWQAVVGIVMLDSLLEEAATRSGLWSWGEHAGALAAPWENYLVWGIVMAGAYWYIPRQPRLSQRAKFILIALTLYFFGIVLSSLATS